MRSTNLARRTLQTRRENRISVVRSHAVLRSLPYAAGYATAFGLPHDEALKAITLNAAEIWGVADRLGSIDVGKTANVVVADGDPLDVKTDVKEFSSQDVRCR